MAIYEQLGLTVTICIVAYAHQSNCIVSASDRRLSFGDAVESADDAALKLRGIGRQWYCLYAANDISAVSGVIQGARERLEALKLPKEQRYSVRAVREAFEGSYRTMVHDRIVGDFLCLYGFKTLDDFLSRGLAAFGQKKFDSLIDEIDKFNLGVSLLVYGFEDPAEFGAHLFSVYSPGITYSLDIERIGTIGSGAQIAQAALATYVGGFASITDAVYRVCEAKFASESASDVGRSTTVVISRGESRNMLIMKNAEVEALRTIWKAERAKGLPEEAKSLLENSFRTILEEETGD